MLLILLGLVQCSGSIDVGCDPVCDYQATWTVEGNNVRFTVSAQTTGWVGIGFSNDQLMVSVYTFEFCDTIGSMSALYRKQIKVVRFYISINPANNKVPCIYIRACVQVYCNVHCSSFSAHRLILMSLLGQVMVFSPLLKTGE